uniref:Isoform 2 of Beta-defensin 123 n=1 Tax=Homo sapiens TaxID=9606 RepID=Q8N688-2|nr:beta-defensin 123 isoform b [Homo sapiens]
MKLLLLTLTVLLLLSQLTPDLSNPESTC